MIGLLSDTSNSRSVARYSRIMDKLTAKRRKKCQNLQIEVSLTSLAFYQHTLFQLTILCSQ